MSIHKKLQQARVILQGKQLKKSGKNKFAGYEYFELADFLPTVVGIFNDLGLCSVVSFTAEFTTLTLTDIEDGQSIVISSPMAAAELKGCHPIQNLGAVQTYQRRYLYVALMDIVEHDALDSSEPKKPESSKSIGQSDFDKLSTEKQIYLQGIAEEIIAKFANSAETAYSVWLDFKATEPLIEEVTACSGLLPSHVRTAFKKLAQNKA